MKKLSKYGLFAFLLISMSLLPMAASAIQVGTELLMLVDVSGSVSTTDFNTQRDGYEAAFRDSDIIAAIEEIAVAGNGGIAASLVYWSGKDQQLQAVGWTQITDSTSSNAFANAIAAAGRPYNGGTGMAAAMNFGTSLFTNNFEGDRLVMDVSGDGSESESCSFTNTNCIPVQNARDAALAAGVDTINALWITDPPFFGTGQQVDALAYGATNVIGGTDFFQVLVSGFDDFDEGVKQKIFGDIKPPSVPEPATLLLLGFGLTGIAGIRRRKFKK